jgi:hypothetical protein
MVEYFTNRTPAFWGCFAGALLMIVGSFGPWIDALGGIVSKSGLDGDGWFTLVFGVAILALSISARGGGSRGRWSYAVCAFIALLGFIIFFVDGSDAWGEEADTGSELFGDADVLDVAWGLWAVGVGSGIATISGIVAAIMSKSEPPAPTPDASPPPPPVPPTQP